MTKKRPIIYLTKIMINFEATAKREQYVGYGLEEDGETIITKVYAKTPEKAQERVIKNLEKESKVRHTLKRLSGKVYI